MSQKSVLLPPDPPKEESKPKHWGVDIPYGVVTIVIAPEGLILDIGQQPFKPKNKGNYG